MKSLEEKVRDLPKRLEFLKEKLKIGQPDIYKNTGIPQSTYNTMEGAGRTCKLEHFILLEAFFDGLWQKKFQKKRSYPFYNGKQLEDITVSWLISGSDAFVEKTNQFIECVQDDFRRRESEMFDELVDVISRLPEKG